jgi:hypothetical protein
LFGITSWALLELLAWSPSSHPSLTLVPVLTVNVPAVDVIELVVAWSRSVMSGVVAGSVLVWATSTEANLAWLMKSSNWSRNVPPAWSTTNTMSLAVSAPTSRKRSRWEA